LQVIKQILSLNEVKKNFFSLTDLFLTELVQIKFFKLTSLALETKFAIFAPGRWEVFGFIYKFLRKFEVKGNNSRYYKTFDFGKNQD